MEVYNVAWFTARRRRRLYRSRWKLVADLFHREVVHWINESRSSFKRIEYLLSSIYTSSNMLCWRRWWRWWISKEELADGQWILLGVPVRSFVSEQVWGNRKATGERNTRCPAAFPHYPLSGRHLSLPVVRLPSNLKSFVQTLEAIIQSELE